MFISKRFINVDKVHSILCDTLLSNGEWIHSILLLDGTSIYLYYTTNGFEGTFFYIPEGKLSKSFGGKYVDDGENLYLEEETPLFYA